MIQAREELSRLGSQFLDMFHAMTLTDTKYLAYKPIRVHVSTMTLTAKLIGFTDAHFESLKTSTVLKTKPSTFSSAAVHVSFPDLLPSICVKAFRSGSLHVTGCHSPLEFVFVVDCIAQTLDGHTYIDDFKMVMANVNITLPRALRIYEVAEETRRRLIFTEQHRRPPNVLLKFEHTTTMMYGTGKIVFTTKKDVRHIGEIYDLLMALLSSSPAHFFGDPVYPSEVPHWTVLVNTGMPGLLHTHPPCRNVCISSCNLCSKHGNAFSE